MIIATKEQLQGQYRDANGQRNRQLMQLLARVLDLRTDGTFIMLSERVRQAINKLES